MNQTVYTYMSIFMPIYWQGYTLFDVCRGHFTLPLGFIGSLGSVSVRSRLFFIESYGTPMLSYDAIQHYTMQVWNYRV